MSKFKFPWRAEMAPQTPEEVTSAYELNAHRIDDKIGDTARKIGTLKLTLAKMCKELYGHENFSATTKFWKTIIWILGLITVAAFEIPTNSGGFEIFNRTQSQTTFMASAFGIIMAIFSHFTGYCLKRALVEKKHKKNESSATIAAILLIVSFGLFWFIAGFRILYMNKMGYAHTSQGAQAWFAMFVFLFGVVCSFMHTTSAKDVELDKVFRSELRSLHKLQSLAKKLSNEKDAISKQHIRDHASAKYFTNKAEEEKRANEQKYNEEEQERNAEEQQQAREEFEDLLRRFNQIFPNAKEMYDSAPDKEAVKKHPQFIEWYTQLEYFVGVIKDLADRVEGGQEQFETVKENFNSLNN